MRIALTLLHLLFFYMPSMSQPAKSLQGRVLNNDGIPVPFASVRILNSPSGTVTDGQGIFRLKGMRSGPQTVEVSAIGFARMLRSLDIREGVNDDLEFRLQPAAEALDAVVVSADRREDDIFSVPVSVTAFDAKSVAAFRLWDIGELSGLAPTLYSADPGDGRQATSVRGITTTSYDPAVLTVIDGVSQFNLDTYIPQLLDVERIEVLRGPQGTLYGRNAMGGVIKVTTKRPAAGSNTRYELSAGNYGQQRVFLGNSATLLKDRLYLGVALLHERGNGFYRNDATGTGYDRQRRFTGNYHVRYLTGSGWEWGFNLKHSDARNDGAFPLAADKDAAFSQPYVLAQNATARMFDRSLNASMSTQRTGRRTRLELHTAFQRNHRYYDRPLDGDFSPLDIVTIDNNYGTDYNRVSVWTQELRLSSLDKAGDRFRWTAGLFGFLQDNPVKQATRFGKDAGLIGVPDQNFALVGRNLGKGEGLAGFGQATWSINPKLSLTAGLRYDREWKRLSVEGRYEKTGGPSFLTRADTSGSADYGAFSPKAGLQYQFGERSAAHVTYARGFRAGGLSTLGSDPSQPPLIGYNPEHSDHVEIGWKGSFAANRLHTYLSAFQAMVRDAQVPTLILPDAVTVTRNAGTVRSRGLEVETEFRPASGLSVVWRYGLTDAVYTRLRLARNGQEVDLDGNRQILTPAHSSLLVGDYSKPLGRKKRVSAELRAEWKQTGSVVFDLSNTIRQSPYGVVNLRAGVRWKRFGFHAWTRNLTAAKYIDYAYDFGAVHLGDPRTYGFTIARQ